MTSSWCIFVFMAMKLHTPNLNGIHMAWYKNSFPQTLKPSQRTVLSPNNLLSYAFTHDMN